MTVSNINYAIYIKSQVIINNGNSLALHYHWQPKEAPKPYKRKTHKYIYKRDIFVNSLREKQFLHNIHRRFAIIQTFSFFQVLVIFFNYSVDGFKHYMVIQTMDRLTIVCSCFEIVGIHI